MPSCVINVKILTKQNYGKYKSQNLDGDGEPRTADYSRTRLPGSEPPLREGSAGCREGGSVPPVCRGGGPSSRGERVSPSAHVRAPREHTPGVGLTSLPARTCPPVRAPQLHTAPLYADTLTAGQLDGGRVRGAAGGTHEPPLHPPLPPPCSERLPWGARQHGVRRASSPLPPQG